MWGKIAIVNTYKEVADLLKAPVKPLFKSPFKGDRYSIYQIADRDKEVFEYQLYPNNFNSWYYYKYGKDIKPQEIFTKFSNKELHNLVMEFRQDYQTTSIYLLPYDFIKEYMKND